MSVPQSELKPGELKPGDLKPGEMKPDEMEQDEGGTAYRPAPVCKPVAAPRAGRPMPCLKDWDFWRFLVAALGLLWEVLKTTFLR